MSVIDKMKGLSPPMFVLFVSSKFVVGVGIGVLLARYLTGFGGWILLVGVALSIVVLVKALTQ